MLLFSLYCCVAINSVAAVVYVWRLCVAFYFDVWFAIGGCFDCLCRCCVVVWLGLMCLCLFCVVICYVECWFGNCLWFLLRV